MSKHYIKSEPFIDNHFVKVFTIYKFCIKYVISKPDIN